MSVIIRLQNLSWSANSVDIRQFFHGLAIPEGGVHIVGGPKGDAFIAFATDEDARQGMERSGGVIKDAKIKLLLSSRSEMQKVIEQARSAVVAPVVPPPAPAVVSPTPAEQRHRHRSRSRDRREARDRSSPDRRRPRRSSPDRRRSRERSRDRSRRTDDRRRHDDSKKEDRRDRDTRHKSGERPPEIPKVEIPPIATAAEMPPSIPDPTPWKSSFQSIEKAKAAPVWDSIKNTIDAPPMDAGLIPRVPQVPMPGPIYDAMPAPSDRPPVFPEEAKMGPSDFRGPASQMPPVGMSDSRHPSQMHPGEPPMDMPSGPGGFGVPRETRFDFNNKMGQDRPFPPNFNMPMEGSYPPSDMPSYDVQRPMGGMPSSHFNNSHLPSEGNNGMDGPFEPGRPPNDYFPLPSHGGGYGGDGFHGSSSSFGDQRIEGGFPSSNKKAAPRPYLKGYCIEIKSLPLSASYKDVREHFRGLHIPCDGLKICREGMRKNGLAYIKFISERDQMDALSRTGPSRLGPYLEMRPCSEQDFDAGMDPNHNPRNHNFGENNRGSNNSSMRSDEFVVLLKGLPYQCLESDVVNFFKGIKIKNMHIEYDKFGKALGTGMVSFYDSESCTRALAQSHQRIGHRYIEVILSNGPDPRGGLPRQEVGPPNGPSQGPPSGQFEAPYCVAMRHLPTNVIDRDIAHFFSIVGAAPQNIHIMLGFDGRPCGDAFAEFGTQHDFDKAMSRNGQYLFNSCVMLTPINYQEMRDILSRPGRNPEPPMGPMPHDHPREMRSQTQQAWPPQPNLPEEQPPFNDVGYNGRGGGLMPQPAQEMRVPSQPWPAVMQSPEGFGKPGCVVGISGIPPSAGVSDILEFLKEFEIKKEDVIRRFDQAQKPTGDARVSLSSPQDAQRAASMLNSRQIAGHSVQVFVP